jgi:hypothetical protein
MLVRPADSFVWLSVDHFGRRKILILLAVRPEARGVAPGITTLSRHVPMAVSPTMSAYMMQAFSLNVPIFLGGFLQLFHDCVFYYLFHGVKPPEEQNCEPRSAA